MHYFEKALRKVIDTLVHCSAYVQVTIKASERGVFSWSISFPCDIFSDRGKRTLKELSS